MSRRRRRSTSGRSSFEISPCTVRSIDLAPVAVRDLEPRQLSGNDLRLPRGGQRLRPRLAAAHAAKVRPASVARFRPGGPGDGEHTRHSPTDRSQHQPTLVLGQFVAHRDEQPNASGVEERHTTGIELDLSSVASE